jgi:hypothetical protein
MAPSIDKLISMLNHKTPNTMEKPILRKTVERSQFLVKFLYNTAMENKCGKTVQNTKGIGLKENLQAMDS